MSDNKDTKTQEKPAKPSLPESYKPPKVWSQKEMGGSLGSINKPTAGARFEKELPRGKHDLQLYSLGTPNGQKVTILLEELELEYDAYKINIMKGDQFGSGFVQGNPNSKIPLLIDYSVEPPLRVFESGNIQLYLAEKYDTEGKFLPKDISKRTEVLNWLFWMQGAAPYIGGGVGHFYNYAPVLIEYCVDRFAQETKRLVDVLDKQLEGKKYVAGTDEPTIADFNIEPWISALTYYQNDGVKAWDFLDMESYTNVIAYLKRLNEREALKLGKRINGWSDDAIDEVHGRPKL